MQIHKNSICGIVVTYNPDSAVVANVMALREQVDRVLVVDNGSRASSQDYVAALSQFSHVDVYWNTKNLGIATALNVGIHYALHYGYDWVATFDQDSTVTHRMVSAMVETYENCQYKNRVAIICPKYRDRTSGKTISNPTRRMVDSSCAMVFSAFTSGNLVKTAIFDSVGFFRGELFIDLVDYEFNFRCTQKGYLIIEAQTAWLDHNLGSPKPVQLCGKTWLIGNHSAVRRYYWSRNMVWLWRHYWKFLFRHFKWAFRELVYGFVVSLAALVLFERGRRTKIRFVLHGLYDGLIGKLGPLE